MRLAKLGKMLRPVKVGASLKVAGVTLVAGMLQRQLTAQQGEEQDSPEKYSKFKDYFDPARSPFNMTDCKDDLMAGKLEIDKDTLIFLEPYLYNENFLATVHEVVSRAVAADSDLKVYYLSLSQLNADERDKLNSMLNTNLSQETLFLLRRAGNEKFDPLFFNTYFQNSKFVDVYFEKLRSITDKNLDRFMGVLKNKLYPDQVFILAMLDKDEETRRDQIDRLRRLKIDNSSLNSASVGILAISNDWLRDRPMKSGDMAILQSRHYTRQMTDLALNEDRSLIGDGFMVTTIPGGISSADIGKRIADTYYATNTFYHSEMIEQSDAKYIVKSKIDYNAMSQSDIRKSVERMQSYKACLRDKLPNIYDATVFLTEAGKVTDDESEELTVVDTARSDMKLM